MIAGCPYPRIANDEAPTQEANRRHDNCDPIASAFVLGYFQSKRDPEYA